MKKYIYIVLALAAAVACTVAFNWLRDNKLPNFDSRCELFVYPDTPVSLVRDSLLNHVRHAKSVERVIESKSVEEFMQPGHYVIDKGATSVYAARMLNNGWQTPVKLTLSGTLRKKNEIARKIASQMMVDSATVHNALNDKSLLSAYGFTPQNAFALLVPDTYEMYWTASIAEILQKQKDAYDAFWTESNVAKARRLGLSKQQVAIVASIVSGETNYAPEMPRIAGVYLNRLKTGMKLQADPTIAFCHDYTLNRIMRRHLDIESPYNTYKYAGLPPGPIYVPTKNSLNAVLNPDCGTASGMPGADGNIFFCANSDFSGTHVFAKTLSAHNQNAKAFHKALTKRLEERKKAKAS